jgi:tetratricopeptide (TPR) repeat protein
LSQGRARLPILRRRTLRRTPVRRIYRFRKLQSFLAKPLANVPELADDLATLTSVHRFQWGTDKATVATSCTQIALWAENAGFLPSAVAFAELSAWLSPKNPVAMNLAGRLNRNHRNWRRADLYFERSVGLCRDYFEQGLTRKQRRAIGATKARAFMGWGTLWSDQGNYTRALRLYQRAAWAAQRWGGKWLAAEVHHDMVVLASEMGSYDDAAVYARRALAIYPVHNKRVPALAYDVALLMVRQQIYEPAREVVQFAAEYISSAHEKVIVEALLARAAAGSGNVAQYADAARRVLMAIRSGIDSKAAGALIHLTCAARLIGDWDRAEEHAGEAYRIVEERGLGGEERTLAIQLRREVPLRLTEPPAKGLPTAAGHDSVPVLTEAYLRLMQILRGWRGPTWRRKNQAGPDDRGKT